MGCAECPNGQLHERVSLLEQDRARTNAVLEGIKENLERLVEQGERQIRIEERQIEDRKAIDRAFGAIEDQGATISAVLKDHGTRISALEKDAPTTNLARDWFFDAGKWLIAAAVGGALVKLFT